MQASHLLKYLNSSAILLCLFCSPAIAQETAQKKEEAKTSETENKSETPKKAEENVVVTGTKSISKIDRQTYETSKDPASDTDSTEDALKKVPGVNVDKDGNVSLKGKQVQIYLNGRPSLLLAGDNRGQALKAMPSKLIEKIEVMSAPGAQYSSEGSGGIVNIVTKTKLPPGKFGSYSLKLDSTGGYMPGFFQMKSANKLQTTVYTGFIRGDFENLGRQNFQQIGNNNQINAYGNSINESIGHFAGGIFFGSFEYELAKDDVIGGQINLFKGSYATRILGGTQNYDGSNVLTSDLLLNGPSSGDILNQSVNLNYTHYGKKPDETLKINFDISSSETEPLTYIELEYLKSFDPNLTGTQVTKTNSRTPSKNHALKLEYNTQLGEQQLTTGFEITHKETKNYNLQFGPNPLSALVLNQSLSQFFYSEQIISAGFVTLQKVLDDKWTILGGLRAENLELESKQLFTGEIANISDLRINPSFFATYILSKKEKIRFNYSKRLVRPDAVDYNPRITYRDPFNYYRGNPNLNPQISQGIELSYEFSKKDLTKTLRAFYKADEDLISSQTRFISDPQKLGNQVIETTRVNDGIGSNFGIDYYINKTFSPKFKADLNLIIDRTELKTPVFPSSRSLNGIGGKLTMNYTAKNKDNFQVNFNRTTKSINPLGFNMARSVTGFVYNHNITPMVKITLAGNDIFSTGKTASIISSPFVKSQSVTIQRSPVYSLTIARNFSSFGPPKAK